jgi:hypothetical protein
VSVRASWLWSLAALAALPSLASAQPAPDRCAEGVRDGVALRREGRDVEALELFRSVSQRCPQARVRVQLAWAEQAVGRWVDAERDLVAALATRDDAWVEARRDRLDADLARIREHLGQLQITGGVAGAEVLLDGVVVSTLPMTAPVSAVAGAARLELRREGYYPVRRDVTIAAGVVAREEVQMRPEPPPVSPVEPSVAPPPTVAPTPVRVLPALPPAAPARRDPTWRTLAWTSTLGASALTAATITALIVRQIRFDDFQRDPGCFVDLATSLPSGGAGCVSAHGDVGLATTTALVTGVAAGVFAAGAVFAWVRSSGAQRSERAGELRCLPSPGGAGCSIGF